MSETAHRAYVRYEVDDHVAVVTMDRPERRNALGLELSEQLNQALDRAERDPDVRVVVLTSSGDSFCGGADINPGEVQERDGMTRRMAGHRTYWENGYSRFKPVVGVVRGYALGAGFFLAVRGCDIVVASRDAQFGFPEARAGVAVRPVNHIPVMPFKRMLEFMLLAWKGGELLSAPRAFELGLINSVVDDDQLMPEALRYAALLQRIPPLYVKAVKRGMYRTVDDVLRTAEEREFLEYVLPQQRSGALEEGIRAFAEKREPNFW